MHRCLLTLGAVYNLCSQLQCPFSRVRRGEFVTCGKEKLDAAHVAAAEIIQRSQSLSICYAQSHLYALMNFTGVNDIETTEQCQPDARRAVTPTQTACIIYHRRSRRRSVVC